MQGRLGQVQGQVTDAAVRRGAADAAVGARLTASTLLRRPEQAVQEAVRGLFVSRVFGLAPGDLTDAVKAQISVLARLPAPAVVLLPATATITYSPTSTTQTGQVVGIRAVETPLGTLAAVGFVAQVQLDQGLPDFLQVEVGRRTQASFGVLGTGCALMEAEVSGLLPERQVELTFGA